MTSLGFDPGRVAVRVLELAPPTLDVRLDRAGTTGEGEDHELGGLLVPLSGPIFSSALRMLELGGFDFHAAGASKVSPPASIFCARSIGPAADRQSTHTQDDRDRPHTEPSFPVLRHVHDPATPIDPLSWFKDALLEPHGTAPLAARTRRDYDASH